MMIYVEIKIARWAIGVVLYLDQASKMWNIPPTSYIYGFNGRIIDILYTFFYTH